MTFTAGDLYALALLSAPVDPRAGIQVLEDDTLHTLLSQVPVDVCIADPRAMEILADDGTAELLYDRLRAIESFGYVRTSKLLAFKRPHLIPIRDTVVEHALGAANKRRWWAPMVNAWREPALRTAVTELRRRCGTAVPAYVTDLRLLDVVLWTAGRA